MPRTNQYGNDPASLEVKRKIEENDCRDCGAWTHCSCIVPDPDAPDVLHVNGRHFHWSRVALAWEGR